MNNFIKGLYDAAAGLPDENGIPKMDEQKLRRQLDKTRIGYRNKDAFEELEPKFKTCLRYLPCPVCDKCMAKNSGQFIACQNCKIPTCAHKHDDKLKLIKRENFARLVTKEVMDEIRRQEAEVMKCHQQKN